MSLASKSLRKSPSEGSHKVKPATRNQMIDILKPIPSTVTMVIRMGPYEFVCSDIPGGDAINFFFNKTPHMKTAIRNLEEGQSTQEFPKVLNAAMISVRRPSKSDPKKVNVGRPAASRGSRAHQEEPAERARHQYHPITGRPITSVQELEELQVQIREGKVAVETEYTGEVSQREAAIEDIAAFIKDPTVLNNVKPAKSKCRKCGISEYDTDWGRTCSKGHGIKEDK